MPAAGFIYGIALRRCTYENEDFSYMAPMLFRGVRVNMINRTEFDDENCMVTILDSDLTTEIVMNVIRAVWPWCATVVGTAEPEGRAHPYPGGGARLCLQSTIRAAGVVLHFIKTGGASAGSPELPAEYDSRWTKAMGSSPKLRRIGRDLPQFLPRLR